MPSLVVLRRSDKPGTIFSQHDDKLKKIAQLTKQKIIYVFEMEEMTTQFLQSTIFYQKK
jgi:hypothetical protein